MSEREIIRAEAPQQPESTGADHQTSEDRTAAAIKSALEEVREKSRESLEAMREGKGRLRLEKPIHKGDQDIEELVYDFNDLTGLEYTMAMDSDLQAREAFRITHRQSLALFAAAAAKHTEALDSRDIVESIGMTDAVEGVQLASSFFTASTRAGRLRISKWSSK